MKGTNIATFSNLLDWLTSETNQDFLEVNLAVFRPILNFKSVSCTQILMLNSSTYKQSRIFLENRFNSGHYRWLIDDFDLFLWNLLFSRQTSFFVKQSLKCWFRSILYFVSLTRKLFLVTNFWAFTNFTRLK